MLKTSSPNANNEIALSINEIAMVLATKVEQRVRADEIQFIRCPKW